MTGELMVGDVVFGELKGLEQEAIDVIEQTRVVQGIDLRNQKDFELRGSQREWGNDEGKKVG